jgi:glycosyltransferase involved in cell wall biosynthesis
MVLAERGKRKPVSLAVCIGAYECGGQGKVVQRELEHLREDFQISLFTERLSRPVPPGVAVRDVRASSGGIRVNRDLVEILRGFDLIHCHDSLGFMRAARLTGKPFVVTSHGIAPLRYRPPRSAIQGAATLIAYRSLYRSATCVVAISRFIADWVHRYAGVQTRLIPNGTDEGNGSLSYLPATRKILYVGEVSRRKGIGDLLSIVQDLPEDVQLEIVGRGAIAPFLPHHPRPSFWKRVVIRSELSNDELQSAYRNAFCTITASCWEGFCLPILEGFGYGLPAIARRQGGMQELIELSGAGCTFLHPSEIPDCLAVVTKSRSELTVRARSFAAQHQWRASTAAYARLFDELVARFT